jgi:RimJ/RimL family protein N-acetyltransferase
VPRELPLGAELDWHGARAPRARELRGEHVLLRALDPAGDAEALWRASHPPAGDADMWVYLPDGPYEDAARLREMLAAARASEDPLFFAVVALPGEHPRGMAAYLRIEPQAGSIEIGHVWFGAGLQRSTAASEAIFLLARHAFDDLGYRRLEWKCNALNAVSRRAAERLGFTFEGVFRKHQVVKGRNRDTAWYAIVDDDWPAIRDGFEAWLSAENFDAAGRQRLPLGELIERERQRRA